MEKKYRKNVGIIVCKNHKVLLCARADKKNDCWQFPQGGINDGEDIIEAAKRELYEETGIKSINLIKKMPFSLKYDIPKNYNTISSFDGQDQSWVLFEFLGNDDEIQFDIDKNCIEFKKYKWAYIDMAPTEIVEFKKNVYVKVVEFFKPFVER